MGGGLDRALSLDLGWDEIDSQTVVDRRIDLTFDGQVSFGDEVDVDLSELDGSFGGEDDVPESVSDASRVRIRAYRELVLPAVGRLVPALRVGPPPLPAARVLEIVTVPPVDDAGSDRPGADVAKPSALIDAWEDARRTLRRRCTSLEQWSDAIVDSSLSRARVARAVARAFDLLVVVDRLSLNALSAQAECACTPSAAVEAVVRAAHAFVDLVLLEVEEFVAVANGEDATWGTLSRSFAEHAATMLLATVAPAVAKLGRACLPSDDSSPVMLSVACDADHVRAAAVSLVGELRVSASGT